jgi:hypothetical protein
MPSIVVIVAQVDRRAATSIEDFYHVRSCLITYLLEPQVLEKVARLRGQDVAPQASKISIEGEG